MTTPTREEAQAALIASDLGEPVIVNGSAFVPSDILRARLAYLEEEVARLNTRPTPQPSESAVIDDREPAGFDAPKPGTYLYGIDQLLANATGKDAVFLSTLYDHVNALYVEQRVYKQYPSKPIAQERQTLTDAEAEDILAKIGATWFAPRHTRMSARAIIHLLAAQGIKLTKEGV